jgi:hypothetical protein
MEFTFREVIGPSLTCAQNGDVGTNIRRVRGKSGALMQGTTIASIISKPTHIGKTTFYIAQLRAPKDTSDISPDIIVFRHQRPIHPVVPPVSLHAVKPFDIAKRMRLIIYELTVETDQWKHPRWIRDGAR